MDLDDINRNVKDGLHTAAMAGSWLSIVNGFGGMRLCGGMLSFNPSVPAQWESYRFKITCAGQLLDIFVSDTEVIYTLLEGEELEIMHKGNLIQLSAQKPLRLSNVKQLEAVIFELDGIITDTGEYHYEAWKDLADELALSFDREKHKSLKGLSRMESLEVILESSGLNLPQPVKGMLCNKKNEKYRQLVQQMTPAELYPGIHSVLSDLQQRGIAIGLASVNENALLILERLQIGHWFQAVADPGNLRRSKPDPEIHLQVAEMLGISPDCCVAIEDTEEGIAAINAAGMRSVGAGVALVTETADLCLASTAEISVEKLLELFA
ncbi:Beta-phosphoglucomutase [compost metagenome]